MITGNPRPPSRASRRAAVLSLLVALLAIPALATAQQQPRRPGVRQSRPELERQIRVRFQRMVARELALSDDQAARLDEVVGTFHESRAELARRQMALQRRMAGTGALLSEEESVAVLDELVAVKQEETRLMLAEHERLREVLSPPQLVRFYTLRDELASRIRQMRQGRGGGGPAGFMPGGTSGIWPVLGV